jgi:hypothetical protein
VFIFKNTEPSPLQDSFGVRQKGSTIRGRIRHGQRFTHRASVTVKDCLKHPSFKDTRFLQLQELLTPSLMEG